MESRRKVIKIIASGVLLLAETTGVFGQEHGGHGRWIPSSEQELFDRSPIAEARAIPGLVEVSLPISTGVKATQEFFDQGLAFLHAGWPQEAERSFLTAHLADEDALMPRWGVAMSHLVRDESGAWAWLSGLQDRRDRFTDHSPIERALLEALPSTAQLDAKDAIAWRKTVVVRLRDAIRRLPQEAELKALLAGLLANAWHRWLAELGESRDGAMELIRDVLRQNPGHPAGRMGLQLWANELRHDPYHTKKKYFDAGQMRLSPVFAVHWSLSGRYSAERGAYDVALEHGEMASRIHHQWARLRQAMPDVLPDYARHRAVLGEHFQSAGNAAAAVAIAHDLLRLPRHPVWNAATNSFGSRFAGRKLLLETYRFFGLWEELDQALRDGRIARLEGTLPRAEHAYARAIAAYFRRDDPSFKAAADELSEIGNRVRSDFKDRDRGAKQDAAAAHHDGVLQWLLDGGEEYLTVTEWSRSLEALRRFQAGDSDGVEALLAGSRRVPSLLRSRLLWSVGLKSQARQALLNTGRLPLPKRVEAVGLSQREGDEFPLQFDIDREAVRRAMRPGGGGQLGLSTWEPPSLPRLSIPLVNGGTLDEQAMRGRHTALIFIYSSNCGHCVEQLEALRRHAASLAAAKLDVWVIAGEGRESLAAWIRERPGFPARFGSDEDETWFRQVGAYDDFNRMPLHATLYVDPAGRVLWKDVGLEPFADIEFFVAETLRLRSLFPLPETD